MQSTQAPPRRPRLREERRLHIVQEPLLAYLSHLSTHIETLLSGAGAGATCGCGILRVFRSLRPTPSKASFLGEDIFAKSSSVRGLGGGGGFASLRCRYKCRLRANVSDRCAHSLFFCKQISRILAVHRSCAARRFALLSTVVFRLMYRKGPIIMAVGG